MIIVMKKTILISLAFILISCGPSPEEMATIAQLTCNIMGESRNMDGVLRIKEINAGREKLGEPAFLGSDEDIKESFKYCVNDYIGIHDKIKSTEYTDFRMNRYKIGGFMNQHIDNIHYSHGQKQGYPHLTSLLFLNDDFDGGEFVLCGDKYIEKIQGSAVVFPSSFMYPHEVKEVTNGKRFSVMTWIL